MCEKYCSNDIKLWRLLDLLHSKHPVYDLKFFVQNSSEPTNAQALQFEDNQYRHLPARHPPLWHEFHCCNSALANCVTDFVASAKLNSSSKVIDYGCSTMQYRDVFPADCDYYGADLPGNKYARIMIQPDGRLPVESNSSDFVLSTQVLEHVQDPALYLGECLRVLKPGGRVMVTTHGLFVYHPDPEDNWRWTGAGLIRQIENAGFRVVRSEGLIGSAAAALQFFQDCTKSHLPKFIRPVYQFIMQCLIKLIDKQYPPEARMRNAWVYAIMAEKP